MCCRVIPQVCSQRGIVLVLAMVLVIVPIVVLTPTVIGRSIAQVQGEERHIKVGQAFQRAEAGIDQAVYELRQGPLILGGAGDPAPKWVDTTGNAQCADGAGNPLPCWTKAGIPVLPGAAGETVSLLALNPLTASPTVQATAQIATTTQNQRIEAVISATQKPVTFPEAIAAKTKMGFGNGLVVDSYDSRLGDYGVAIAGDSYGHFAGLNKSQLSVPTSVVGTIQTNGTSTTIADEAIRLGINDKIYGQALIGANGDPTEAVALTSSTKIYNNAGHVVPRGGVPEVASSALDLPAVKVDITPGAAVYSTLHHCGPVATPLQVVIPAGGLHAEEISGWNNCYAEITGTGEVHLDHISFGNGAHLTFSGGGHINLYVKNGVGLGNGSQITVAPGTTVSAYMQGDFLAGNGLDMNKSGDHRPSAFAVFFDDPTGLHRFEVGNGGELYAAIYAPQSEVSLSQGTELYGAAVGDYVHGNHGVSVHYDVALSQYCQGGDTACGPGHRRATVVSWRQL